MFKKKFDELCELFGSSIGVSPCDNLKFFDVFRTSKRKFLVGLIVIQKDGNYLLQWIKNSVSWNPILVNEEEALENISEFYSMREWLAGE